MPDSTSCLSKEGGEKPRSLRPRHAVTNYNEDKTFETLLRAKPIAHESRPTTSKVTNMTPPKPKPDHLVVVYKHQKDKQSASPNRMRLLPAVTYSKLRQVSGKSTSGSDSLVPEEPESDCIDENEFHRYLNLIPKKKLDSTNRENLNTSWPLRQQSRNTVPRKTSAALRSSDGDNDLPSRRFNGNSPITFIAAKTEPIDNSSVDKDESSSDEVTVLEVKSSSSSGHIGNGKMQQQITMNQWQNELKYRQGSHDLQPKAPQLVVRAPNGTLIMKPAETNVPQIIPPFTLRPPIGHNQSNLRASQELREQRRRNTEKFTLRIGSKMDFSSPLGRRMSNFHPYIKQSILERQRLIKKYESDCIRGYRNYYMVHNLAQYRPQDFLLDTLYPGAKHSRKLRSSFKMCDKITSVVTSSITHVHSYTFSRQERLEKFLTLETGLDWKTRLLTWHCQPIAVDIQELKRCNCCRSKVCTQVGHSCGKESDKEQVEPCKRRASDNHPPPPPLQRMAIKRSSSSTETSIPSKLLRSSPRNVVTSMASDTPKPMTMMVGSLSSGGNSKLRLVPELEARPLGIMGQSTPTKQANLRKALNTETFVASRSLSARTQISGINHTSFSSSSSRSSLDTCSRRSSLASSPVQQRAEVSSTSGPSYELFFEPEPTKIVAEKANPRLNVSKTNPVRLRNSFTSRTGLESPHKVTQVARPGPKAASIECRSDSKGSSDEEVVLIGGPSPLKRTNHQLNRKQSSAFPSSNGQDQSFSLDLFSLKESMKKKMQNGSQTSNEMQTNKTYFDKKSQILIDY